MTRHALLASLLLAALAAPAAATAPDPRVRHVLERLSAGPAPGDVERVTREGLENYIREQLDASLPEPPALAARLAALEAVQGTPAELFERHGEGQEKRERRREAKELLEEAQTARLLRAVGSPRQLEEQMVAFWLDHFNVFSGKGLVRMWVGSYESQAIRPHALGRFRDLLGAVAHHPAMLFYLDNWQSSGNREGTRRSGLNENYARELLELHTLGVDGGYSQTDVTELANVLTGWGFKPRPAKTPGGYSFHFESRRHAPGTKHVLGQRFAPAGQAEGEHALDMLAAHPATARHIARKLAVYFVSDSPPPALVDGVAARFTASNGDVRSTLDALFHRPEFWDSRHQGAKLKTPYQLVVSAARALGPLAPPPARLARAMAGLGQPLYGCPTPDGYKQTRGAWLSPDAMTRRVALAVQLANGRLDQPAFGPRGLDPLVLAATLGDPFGPTSRKAIAAAPPRMRPALMLGSPEFNQR